MGKPAIDLTGRAFGRWTGLGRAGGPGGRAVRWACRCDPARGGCGAEGVVESARLRRGLSRGCIGCAWRHRASPPREASPRDAAIVAARRAGETLQAIADRHGLTRQRVHAIVRAAESPDNE